VHIPHDVGALTGYRMYGLDYYDAVLLTGEFQEKYIRELEELRGTVPKETRVVGSTYMDAMHERKSRLEDHSDKNTDEKTILVAPSWGKSSILNQYGETFLKCLKETGYRIIVRPHPQSKTSESSLLEHLQKEFPDTDKWSWNYDNDNFGVLSRSDLMISDFSSVIYDFALIFGKPIIYADTHFDKAPYDSFWIKDEPWNLKMLPTIGQKLKEEEFEDIREVIEKALTDKAYEAGRENAKTTVWKYQGEAAGRVVDYLIEKQELIA
jgi:CDP-glycerol glycerophosphotransferase (TagB/SpsB family)